MDPTEINNIKIGRVEEMHILYDSQFQYTLSILYLIYLLPRVDCIHMLLLDKSFKRNLSSVNVWTNGLKR